MYIPDFGLMVIQPPKCGTYTVEDAIKRRHKNAELPGHVPQPDMERIVADKRWAPAEAAVVLVRHPLERFLSGLNHVYGGKRTELPKAITEAIAGDNIVFRSQVSFLGGEIPTRLLPFEDMPELMEMIGHEGPPPHLNQSYKRFQMRELDPFLPHIMKYVQEDMRLREAAMKPNAYWRQQL